MFTRWSIWFCLNGINRSIFELERQSIKDHQRGKTYIVDNAKYPKFIPEIEVCYDIETDFVQNSNLNFSYKPTVFSKEDF